MTAPVLAATNWATNADLIEDVARLGYLKPEDHVLDPTYGRGGWWKKWIPARLVAHDINPDLCYPRGYSIDFRAMPYDDATFDVVAFDPPYKLNGTPTAEVDERYGVHVVAGRAERHQMIRDGIVECLRVLKPGGYLLVKCQDQVNGGKVRWQTIEFTHHAERVGPAVLVDMLHMLGGRPQPEGRSQQHARRNMSTLLVLKKLA
jgi:SAM-dependent methyltransferase